MTSDRDTVDNNAPPSSQSVRGALDDAARGVASAHSRTAADGRRDIRCRAPAAETVLAPTTIEDSLAPAYRSHARNRPRGSPLCVGSCAVTCGLRPR
jgi:hypothetical protein